MLNEKLFTLIKAPIITEKSARLNEKFMVQTLRGLLHKLKIDSKQI